MSAKSPATPFVRLGRMLLALAVCASLGLHWAALQTVAWTQMLVTYSQQADLGEAVKKTFGGEHPCNLCLLVKHGQDEQKEQDAVPLTLKLDAVLACQAAAFAPAARTVEFPDFQTHGGTCQDGPPGPPPRG